MCRAGACGRHCTLPPGGGGGAARPPCAWSPGVWAASSQYIVWGNVCRVEAAPTGGVFEAPVAVQRRCVGVCARFADPRVAFPGACDSHNFTHCSTKQCSLTHTLYSPRPHTLTSALTSVADKPTLQCTCACAFVCVLTAYVAVCACPRPPCTWCVSVHRWVRVAQRPRTTPSRSWRASCFSWLTSRAK